MSDTSQKRALNNYRKRLNQRGMARFEVLGLDTDRELIRSLARRLAETSRCEVLGVDGANNAGWVDTLQSVTRLLMPIFAVALRRACSSE